MVKILVCGDVKGNFASVFNRVSKLKSQEFSALFCVGDFFAPDVDTRIQLASYLSGTESIPIPTYFILGSEGKHTEVVDENAEEGGAVCHNLQYLGRYGITTISGLRVAFLSGVYNKSTFRKEPTSSTTAKYEANYSSSHVEALFDHYRLSYATEGVDLLLTCEWGKHFSSYLAKNIIPEKILASGIENFGSPVVGELLGAMSPRYHFAGREGVFFQLPPYRNQVGSFTRFLGLGAVGGNSNQKDLYACNVTSVSSKEPVKTPEILTENPYTIHKNKNSDISQEPASKKIKSGDSVDDDNKDATYNRWGLSQQQVQSAPNVTDLQRGGRPTTNRNAPPRGYKCRLCSASNHFAVNCPQGPRRDACWFCLGSPGVESHLVCSIGTEVYLTLAKGPLEYDHFLLLPVDHISSFYGLPRSTQAEVAKFKDSLRSCFAKRHKKVVFWDRNIQTARTLHMNIQALAIPEKRWENAKNFIIKEAGVFGLKFEEMDPREDPADEGYLIIELDEKIRLCCTQTNNRELFNFGRTVFADLLGKPEASNWKACELSMEQEKKLVSDFKQQFKPFETSDED